MVQRSRMRATRIRGSDMLCCLLHLGASLLVLAASPLPLGGRPTCPASFATSTLALLAALAAHACSRLAALPALAAAAAAAALASSRGRLPPALGRRCLLPTLCLFAAALRKLFLLATLLAAAAAAARFYLLHQAGGVRPAAASRIALALGNLDTCKYKRRKTAASVANSLAIPSPNFNCLPAHAAPSFAACFQARLRV